MQAMTQTKYNGLAETRRYYVCCHKLDCPPIASAFSLARFAAQLQERRGRPVYVIAMRSGPVWARAWAWVADPAADWIAHRYATTHAERITFAVHQTAHMLLGHQGNLVDPVTFINLLFPRLHRALGPGSGRTEVTCGIASGDEEREASALAAHLIRSGLECHPTGGS